MNNGYNSVLPTLRHVGKKKKKQMDIQIKIHVRYMTLHTIMIIIYEIQGSCHTRVNGLHLTCKLIANYNDIIHTPQYKLAESDENINNIFDIIFKTISMTYLLI